MRPNEGYLRCQHHIAQLCRQLDPLVSGDVRHFDQDASGYFSIDKTLGLIEALRKEIRIYEAVVAKVF